LAKKNVGLLFGGKSAEHEVSIMSARSVYEFADRNKYNIYPIAVDRDGNWLTKKESKKIIEDSGFSKVPSSNSKINKKGLNNFLENNYDVIFPLIHGPYGEDGKIQGFFELLEIPYVGVKVLGSSIGMDKGIMKKLFDYNGLKQTKFITIKHFDKNKVEKINEFINRVKLPIFIKPANLGSSIGISKVSKNGELKRAVNNAFKYDNKIIVEKSLKAREIECSVIGKNQFEASLPGEIIPSHEFYDYNSKYQDQQTKLIIPAELNKKLIRKIQEMAIKAFEIIDGEGLARVDFFLANNDIYINEINTIPGFTKYSMYPKLWEATGLSYSNLIDELINIALDET